MPHRLLYVMETMKVFLYEVANAFIFLIYVFMDAILFDTSIVLKMIGAIVFALYFLNQIKWRIVEVHYDGSWKAWIKDWFGLKGNGK